MRTLIAIALTSLTVAACSSSGGSAKPSSSAPTTPASTTASQPTRPATSSTHAAAGVKGCLSAVGQPVPRDGNIDKQCGDDAYSQLSFGCYHSGNYVGDFYMTGISGAMVYGVPGGVWHQGPEGISMTAAAKAIGC